MFRHQMDDQRCSSHAQSPVCPCIRLSGRISQVISWGKSYTNLMLPGRPVALFPFSHARLNRAECAVRVSVTDRSSILAAERKNG
jgi:hypothetical protein